MKMIGLHVKYWKGVWFIKGKGKEIKKEIQGEKEEKLFD